MPNAPTLVMPMLRRFAIILCLFVPLVFVPVAAAAHRHRAARRKLQEGCDGYPSTRDPANPLMLADAPGPNPLSGAPLFVDGPRNGVAAGAIARLLGLNPDRFSENYSWARFAQAIDHGRLHRKLAHNPTLARQVALLATIARQPEEARFSPESGGGGPGAVARQVNLFLCHTMQADPGTVPVITTYFLYQHGYCESANTILAYRSRFERQVDEFAQALGDHPAVVLMELDAIGASRCMSHTGALSAWEDDISYEIGKVAALPHTVAYLEAGYPDGNPPGYTAQVFNAVGGDRLRGFLDNDGHNEWTIDAVRWGRQVSRLTHDVPFVVDTATNGQGPLLNPDPVHQGIEDLCNAPGRGLGPPPSTQTGLAGVDAFLWAGVPGNSAGSCHGGPRPGVFWTAQAAALAARANSRLGPGFASDPY